MIDSSERGIGHRIWFITKVTLSISVERKKQFMIFQLQSIVLVPYFAKGKQLNLH